MNISSPFIHRPVATTLITIGVVLAGLLGFARLPIAPLPQVDFPTINVGANLPGASPDTMAATVATPLERALGNIAGVTEITSRSSLGNTSITLQFDLNRDIDGAARDVQSAINAARTLLPSGMPSNPTYRKVNPADSPIMVLSLTSATRSRGQMYDVASTVLAQRLAQVQGVGQVNVAGAALPAVRVELDPDKLASRQIPIDAVRQAIVATNVNRPKGSLEAGDTHWQVGANDQAMTAADFAPTILTYRAGAAVRLRDVADVIDSVQDVRNDGMANDQPAVVLLIMKAPGANVIETVQRIREVLPRLQASIPAAIDFKVVSDRTPSIRNAMREVERSLAVAIGLVILVVLAFLRDGRATLLPAVAVPVSLAGTLGLMYLLDYSLDNLSAMALTVATGFVVDDAIVVAENINRHLEKGFSPLQAALRGASEIGFTVVSISISLIAVFIPILLMGGVVGRLFREFAVVLSCAILVSMVVSLTVTPMMAARLLKAPVRDVRPVSGLRALLGRMGQLVTFGYRHSLKGALRHPLLTLAVLAGVVVLNVKLYGLIPKSFFPQQDNGLLIGNVQADQASSFQAMQLRMRRFMKVLRADPAVAQVTASTGGGGGPGGGGSNSATFFVNLKPLTERTDNADAVITRLRRTLGREPGANLFLFPAQDLRIGGRPGNAQFQYTVLADDVDDLRRWGPRVRNALTKLPELADVNTDQQDKGEQTQVVIDREAATRLGVNVASIDTALNDAFGQRQVGVIYNPLNQYRVVMEWAPAFLQAPASLQRVEVFNKTGEGVPLASFAHIARSNTPLTVNHQSGTPASTISYNLAPGVSMSQATQAIDEAVHDLGLPTSVRGGAQGTANAFQQSLSTQPLLIGTAILAIYLVLGMLYESLIHPVTILSTLPSAGVGALLALMACGTDFSIIALIGVILLIGIVKKNAIMMIDFAIMRQRQGRLSASQAIYQAACLRARPIMMTTAAAMLGAVPLAIGHGEGAELRQPLGIAIVGGLALSQLLTLYTTPVVYVLMDRLRPARTRGQPAPAALSLQAAHG